MEWQIFHFSFRVWQQITRREIILILIAAPRALPRCCRQKLFAYANVLKMRRDLRRLFARRKGRGKELVRSRTMRQRRIKVAYVIGAHADAATTCLRARVCHPPSEYLMC